MESRAALLLRLTITLRPSFAQRKKPVMWLCMLYRISMSISWKTRSRCGCAWLSISQISTLNGQPPRMATRISLVLWRWLSTACFSTDPASPLPSYSSWNLLTVNAPGDRINNRSNQAPFGCCVDLDSKTNALTYPVQIIIEIWMIRNTIRLRTPIISEPTDLTCFFWQD